jgi:hypothetical protein
VAQLSSGDDILTLVCLMFVYLLYNFFMPVHSKEGRTMSVGRLFLSLGGR